MSLETLPDKCSKVKTSLKVMQILRRSPLKSVNEQFGLETHMKQKDPWPGFDYAKALQRRSQLYFFRINHALPIVVARQTSFFGRWPTGTLV